MQLPVQSTVIGISVAVISLLLSSIAITFSKQKMGAASEITEIHGVKIERNPPQSRLDELRVSSWPTWSHGPSKFPWTFKSTETMYLLEGKVKVKVQVLAEDGGEEKEEEEEEEEEWFEIRGGDLAVFPKGMNIMWDMVESVHKHYHLDKEEEEAGDDDDDDSASAQSA